MPRSALLLLLLAAVRSVTAAEPLPVWPGLAPGETTQSVGTVLPPRDGETKPITRVENISQPTFTVHRPEQPNGAAAIILPGGGFVRVVPDLEGTEAAEWLNQHGVTAFVLSYRTTPQGSESPGWAKPLQDIQRMVSLIRSRSDEWGLRKDRIGIVAFSAGGQVGARLLCGGGHKTYDRLDAVDELSHRPDFAVLVYPWNMYDAATDRLVDGLTVPADCPPTYIVHTHDDRSSSLGAVLLYVGLKKHNIPAELHVYGNGGHGYGLRQREGSQISTWPDHAAHWLGTQGMLN